jgi:hypothetical protein
MNAFREIIRLSLKGTLVGSAMLAIYGIVVVNSLETSSLWKMSGGQNVSLLLKLYALILPAAFIVAIVVTAIARRSVRAGPKGMGARGKARVLGTAALLGLLPYCLLIVFSMNVGVTLVQVKNIIVTLALPTALSAIIGAMMVIRGLGARVPVNNLRED